MGKLNLIEKVDYFEQFRKNWFIIAFIAGLIVAWTNVQNNIGVANGRITKLESQIENLSPVLLQIQKDIVEIKTTLFTISKAQ